jgi:adenosine/AMP kinase
MEIKIIKVEKPEDCNLILGQSHFIKSIEDLEEVMVSSCPSVKFGVAFCESSGPCLVRVGGNDENLKQFASKNAVNIAAGHSFIIFMKGAYPINVLNAVKGVQEVCSIYCATANNVEVVVAETEQGRGILGVVDGVKSKGVETPEDVKKRKEFLRKLGYKL